jgi:hypothetical protein
MEPEQYPCPTCQTPIQKEFNFCPHCGKKFHEPPQATGFGRQLVVYLVSFFLPPLGLWPGIKYLKQPDKKSRIIGWITIILTALSIVISVWLTMAMLEQYSKILDSQMQTYQQMGL